jgi:hypothetical protein
VSEKKLDIVRFLGPDQILLDCPILSTLIHARLGQFSMGLDTCDEPDLRPEPSLADLLHLPLPLGDTPDILPVE